ncbi:hypothetical protein BH11MYX3_BH11MYX3_01260 [soil metagenome]
MLAAFATGELTEPEIQALAPHLDICSMCFGLVGQLGRAVAETAELPPGAMVARYQILSLIGRGAFGAVYAAYDPELDRKVALKLVPHRRADDEERFLREARAMARVSSAHVVAVHDVGRIDDGLFIAMGFVDGQTLGAWLVEKTRSSREIIGAFVQAGHGLAAAHAEGIVHRDFKPENVLVDRSGHVAVTDFGLAWRTATTEVRDDEVGLTEPLASLTAAGALIGTPIYMAPEALRREPVDARSDVFSFSVALYAALYGSHPFPAKTLAELAIAISTPPRPPRDAKVPNHVRDAVLVGLHAAPADRPQTMLAMVRALERDPRRTGVALASFGALAIAVTVIVAARLMSGSTGAPDCRSRAKTLIDDTWGAPQHAAVRAGITASRSPLALDAVGRVESALDRYAGAWQRGWVEACEAEETHEMAPVLLARRMGCLDRRRAQWDSLVATLTAPDETAVLGASSAAYALPGTELCADPRWLATASSPQDDARLTAAYAAIAKAQVLSDLGSTRAGLSALEQPLSVARITRDRALEAAARVVEGDLRRAVDPRSAEAPLHAAAIAASSVGRLDLEARAKILLVQTLSHSQLRIAESAREADYAEAAAVRLGDPALIVDYLYARGLAEWSAGGAERSIPLERLTLLTAIVVHGPEHPKVAEALNSIAVSFLEIDRVADSLPLQRAALAMRERLQGPSHPEALNARGNLALVLAELGKAGESVVMQESVAVDRARILGDGYFLLDETWIRLANLYQWELGRPGDALRAARRAREIDEQEYGTEAPEGIASLSTLARVLAAQGQQAEALTTSTHALHIAQASLPPTHALVRTTLITYALALEAGPRCMDAMTTHLVIDQTWTSPRIGRMDRAVGLMSRARCEAATGNYAQAVYVLKRALELREQARGSASPLIADVLVEIARIERLAGHLPEARIAARRAVAVRIGASGSVLAAAQAELAK